MNVVLWYVKAAQLVDIHRDFGELPLPSSGWRKTGGTNYANI